MPFVAVAKVCDMPAGSAKYIEQNGLEIALFRLGDGFYATSNLCLHQAGPLAEGTIEGDEVICPWHHWRFNVKTGTSPLNLKLRLQTYPVRQEGGDVLIDIP